MLSVLQNAKYTSEVIQNEIISNIKSLVLKKISTKMTTQNDYNMFAENLMVIEMLFMLKINLLLFTMLLIQKFKLIIVVSGLASLVRGLRGLVHITQQILRDLQSIKLNPQNI